MKPSNQDLLDRATRALDSGRLEQALALCEQALARSRRNPHALYLMGSTLYALHERDEAIAYLERCARLDPKNAAAHLRLGEVLTADGQYTAALSRFEKAHKLDPKSTAAICGKAEVFDRRNQHERVGKLLDPLVRSGRVDATTARLFGRYLWKSGRDDEAIRLAQRQLDDSSTPPAGRRKLCFLLGKIRERRGEYDDAFSAYRAANETAGKPYDADAYRRRIDELIDIYSRENLQRYARSTLKPEGPVFIVGMPRTGSTLVERIIDAHPAARGLGEIAEMNRIARSLSLTIGSPLPYPQCVRDLTPATADEVGTGYVEAVRKKARPAKRAVDKYLPNFENLGLLSLILPKAHIIECRRNPMDACLSCFAEPLHPSGHPWASSLEHLGTHYRQYARLMEHWKRLLDIPLMEVQYEDLVADQEAVSRRIIDFIGLPWDDQCLRYYELKRQIMTLSREQVDKPVYRHAVNRAERFARHLGPLERALAGEE